MRSASLIATVFTAVVLNGNIASALPLERRAQDGFKVGGSTSVAQSSSEQPAAGIARVSLAQNRNKRLSTRAPPPFDNQTLDTITVGQLKTLLEQATKQSPAALASQNFGIIAGVVLGSTTLAGLTYLIWQKLPEVSHRDQQAH